MNDSKVQLARCEDTYSNALALFLALKGGSYTPRRAELKQGEVTAEPLDYMADIQLKSKRILSPIEYAMLLRLIENETPDVLPTHLEQKLGEQFLKSKLDASGDYRVLYYRAKNARLHDTIEQDRPQFPEEIVTPEDILE